jgi:hypothetical protein
MFYGQGAGAGATASAVVGDLIPVIAYDGFNPIVPGFNKTDYSPKEAFADFVSKSYVALPEGTENAVSAVFGEVTRVSAAGEYAFITEAMTEADMQKKLASLGIAPLSRIRFL